MRLVGSDGARVMIEAKTTNQPRSEGALPRIVLMSRSPRRREFLRDAGIEHVAVTPHLEDAHLEPGDVDAARWVSSLAYLKARAGVDWYHAQGQRELDINARWLVLGADTACVRDGRTFGTPRGRAEAASILRALRGGPHEVITGVALIDPLSGRRWVFRDTAVVDLGPISDAQIDQYVLSDEWRGKAGAYNLSERLQAGWPLTCTGDQTTVMGLPMVALLRRLRRLSGELETAA